MVEARGLTKRFDGITAVDDVTINIEGGEIVGLVGPNGAGKTTLIRLFIGLIAPTRGSLRVLGHSMPRGRKEIARCIGYMPQVEAIYPDLTVRENLEFFARLYGLKDKEERRRAVARSMRFIGLSERSDSPVKTLSGGMRRRVSLGAALIHQPRLIVLDEPTVGVDPDLRASMWNGFNELAGRGTTVLLSTHYMGEADRCTRIALLDRGSVIADGSPTDLRRSIPWESSLVITAKDHITRAALEDHLGEAVEGFEADGHLLTIQPGEVDPSRVIGAVEELVGVVHVDRSLPSVEDAFLYYAGDSDGHR